MLTIFCKVFSTCKDVFVYFYCFAQFNFHMQRYSCISYQYSPRYSAQQRTV